MLKQLHTGERIESPCFFRRNWCNFQFVHQGRDQYIIALKIYIYMRKRQRLVLCTMETYCAKVTKAKLLKITCTSLLHPVIFCVWYIIKYPRGNYVRYCFLIQPQAPRCARFTHFNMVYKIIARPLAL